ncbi:MAG TPA: hypothetical protein VMW35_06540 [Myxococcota bacterium]|jgi:hypothetical protein|nr:hypothetical protein [Myxococcota bacterium]
MLRAILALLVALYIVHHMLFGPIRPPDGLLAPREPVQQEVADGPRWQIRDYDLHALARYDIEARVLGTERYRFDRESQLSPIDFAVGWGPMSTNAVLDTLDISQHGRFFFWQTDTEPLIDPGEIVRHAANMHLIPAADEIQSQLFAVRTGQVVTLRGWLVEVHGADGFRWKSSLSRGDTEGGACELMLVESVSVR